MKRKIFFLIAIAIIRISDLSATTYYARTNGDWNSFFTWISSSWMPGIPSAGDDVIIDGYRVTIPSGYNAKCRNLTLKADSRNADAYLRINDGGRLTVGNNITVESPNNRDKNIDLYVYGRIDVGGNMNFVRANNNTRQKRLRLYIEGGEVKIDGDFRYRYENASTWETSSNEIEIRNGGSFACRNFYINKINGGGFKIYTKDGTATQHNLLRTLGDFNITDNAGNLFYMDLNGYTNVDIRGDLNATFSCDYDSKIELNDYSEISVRGDININKTDGNKFRLTLSDYSKFISLNNISININNYNGSWQHAYIELSDNAQLIAGGSLSIVQNHNSSNTLKLDFKDNTVLSVGNLIAGSTFTLSNTNGYQTYFRLRDNARGDIIGNATITHNAKDTACLLIDNNAQLNISGNLTYNFHTSNNWKHLSFQINHNGQFSCSNLTINNTSSLHSITRFYVNRDARATINGDLDINHSTLNQIQFFINENSASSTGAYLTVYGDLTIDNTSTTSPESHTYIHINRDANVSVSGNFNINNHNSQGALFVDINRNGTSSTSHLNIGGNFIMQANNVRDMRLTAFNNANVTINGNMEIIAGGYNTTWGDLNFHLKDNAYFVVRGNTTFDKTQGAEFNFHLENYAIYVCNGAARFGYNNSTEDWAGFLFNFEDNSKCAIDEFVRIYNTSPSLHNPTQINISDNAWLKIGENDGSHSYNLDLRHNSLAEVIINCKDNSTLTVYGKLIFNKQNNNPWSDGKIELIHNATATIYDDLVLKNSNDERSVIVHLYDDNNVLNVRGNIDMRSASSPNRIKIQLDDGSKLHIGGSFLRNAIPHKYGILDCRDNSTVYYDGDGTFGQQVIAENYGDGGDGFAYQNVVINNTWNNVPQLTMEGPTEIIANRNLAFIDGIVEATSTKYFIIQDDATVSDASDNSYVQGWIHKIGDDAFIFPVGNTDNDDGMTRYAPLTLTPYSMGIVPSASTEFAVSYTNVNPNAVGDTALREPTLDHISKEEYWLINKIYANSTWDVTLSWNYPRSGEIDDVNEIRVAHWNGALWQDYGNDGTTGTTTNGTITVQNISNFSPFTLASITSENPLPIELTSFTAKCINNSVKLEWETMAEINNNYFTIERSRDGIRWVEISKIKGEGNSNTNNYYSFIDKDIKGNYNYYYRLKQTDFDGKTKELKITTVKCNGSANENLTVKIYPNPNTGTFYIDGITQDATIEILNINGQIVYKTNINENNRKVTTSLPNGVYNVQIITNDNVISKKVIINK